MSIWTCTDNIVLILKPTCHRVILGADDDVPPLICIIRPGECGRTGGRRVCAVVFLHNYFTQVQFLPERQLSL